MSDNKNQISYEAITLSDDFSKKSLEDIRKNVPLLENYIQKLIDYQNLLKEDVDKYKEKYVISDEEKNNILNDIPCAIVSCTTDLEMFISISKLINWIANIYSIHCPKYTELTDGAIKRFIEISNELGSTLMGYIKNADSSSTKIMAIMEKISNSYKDVKRGEEVIGINYWKKSLIIQYNSILNIDQLNKNAILVCLIKLSTYLLENNKKILSTIKNRDITVNYS